MQGWSTLTRKKGLTTRTAIVRKKGLRPVSDKRKRARRKPKSLEQFHFDRLRHEVGCLVTGQTGEHVTIHHVTAPVEGGRQGRTDRRVVPLIREYHQHDYGKESVERLGHGGFYETHGIDLWAEADRLWAETMALWMQAHGLTTAAQMEAAQ